MITDQETNFIYFSSCIKENIKYAQFWSALQKTLIENNIPHGFIENSRDIWCRDYMPLQKSDSEFVQFTYFPDYLISPKYISKLTIPAEVKTADNINRISSELIIDGANILSVTTIEDLE